MNIHEHMIDTYLNLMVQSATHAHCSDEERKQSEHHLGLYLVNKIRRKKFRRRFTEKTHESVYTKVMQSIKNAQPVHFVVPFGGYKHAWNASSPEPDWAEFFHLMWMIEYFSPMLAAYKPGVILEYASEDMIISRMDNYPQKSIDTYAEKFQELIAWCNERCPQNLDIRYFRVADKFDRAEVLRRVESLLPERRKAFATLSPEVKERELRRSSRSVLWDGEDDLTQLSSAEKDQRIIDSRLIELAYYEVEGSPEFLGEYYWNDNHICTCFSFGLSHDNDIFQDLTVSSAYGSIVDYWIGRGVLDCRTNKWHPLIVSDTQYRNLGAALRTIPITVDLPSLKNLHTLEIIAA